MEIYDLREKSTGGESNAEQLPGAWPVIGDELGMGTRRSVGVAVSVTVLLPSLFVMKNVITAQKAPLS